VDCACGGVAADTATAEVSADISLACHLLLYQGAIGHRVVFALRDHQVFLGMVLGISISRADHSTDTSDCLISKGP
jgi:hypothetical protein